MKRLTPFALLILPTVAYAQFVPPPPGPTAPVIAPQLPPGVVAPPVIPITKPATVQPPLTGIAPPPIATCPKPDLARCQEAGYLRTACGGLTWANECTTLIRNALHARVSAGTTPGARGFRGNRVLVEPQDFSGFEITGMDNFALGGARLTQLKAMKPNAPANASETAWTLLKGFWHANGNQVASCREYAHEKFWSFSVFQDLSAPKGAGDYRGYYDLANVELAKPLRSKDGATTFAIEFPTNAPKNEYYRGPVATGRGYPPGQQAYQFNPAVLAWRNGAPTTPVQDLAWHRSMANLLATVPALSSITDRDLEEMYVRQMAYKELDREREWSIWRYLIRKKEIDDANQTAAWKTMSLAALQGETGREMRALDAQLEAALIQAKIDGCLEPNRFTKCDWSPHLFADVVQGSLLEQKQDAYKTCMKWTKGDFTAGAHITRAQSNGVPGTSCQDCTVSTTKMEEYFTKFEAQLKRLEPIRYDSKTGKPILGGSSGDNSREGSSMFRASASWGGGFEGKSFLAGPTSYCKADVRSYGTFETKLTVLGVDIPIINSNLDLYTQPHPSQNLHASASLRVLGQDLMTPINSDDSSFHIAAGPNKSASQGAATYIVIIAVPLKLEAGATGAVGLDYVLSGSLKRNCENAAASGVPAQSALIKGAATIKPWLRFDAYASVSLDLLIAEAGVEATLTLIKVALPLTSTLEVKPDAQNKLAFVNDTNMNLDIRSLDGKVVVFVEFAGEEAQKRIAGWSGFHTRQPLLDWDRFSVPFDLANTLYTSR